MPHSDWAGSNEVGEAIAPSVSVCPLPLPPSLLPEPPPAHAVTASAVVTAMAAAAAAFFHRIIFESSWLRAIPLRIASVRRR